MDLIIATRPYSNSSQISARVTHPPSPINQRHVESGVASSHTQRPTKLSFRSLLQFSDRLLLEPPVYPFNLCRLLKARQPHSEGTPLTGRGPRRGIGTLEARRQLGLFW